MKKRVITVILCILAYALMFAACFGGCYYLIDYSEMTAEQKVEAEQAMKETLLSYREIFEKYSVQNIETNESYVIVPDYHPKRESEILDGEIKGELSSGVSFEITVVVFFNEDEELTVRHERLLIQNASADISELSIDFQKTDLVYDLLKLLCDTSEAFSELLMQYQTEIIEKWENGEYEDCGTYASIVRNGRPFTVSANVQATMQYYYDDETYHIYFKVQN